MSVTERPHGQKLYIQIASEIRSMIEDGQLQPGDKLPPLSVLADRFGCSRATVREALGSLRGQGLVEFRHGDGTYVRTASVDMWMEPLEAAVLLSLNQVQELVSMQTAILAAIATEAAKRRPYADFSALAYSLFQLECSAGLGEQAIAAELAFYMTLAECANNSMLENALRILQEALRSSLRTLNPKLALGLKICREVYDSVQMEDAKRARDAIYVYGEEIVRQLNQKRRKN